MMSKCSLIPAKPSASAKEWVLILASTTKHAACGDHRRCQEELESASLRHESLHTVQALNKVYFGKDDRRPKIC